MRQERKFALIVTSCDPQEKTLYWGPPPLDVIGLLPSYQNFHGYVTTAETVDETTYRFFGVHPYNPGATLEFVEETSIMRRLFPYTSLEAVDSNERIPVKKPNLYRGLKALAYV